MPAGPVLCFAIDERRYQMPHRLLMTSLLAATVLAGTAACSSPAPAQSPGGPRQDGPASPAPSGQGSTPIASPGVAAVTAGGALVVLNPSTGAVIRTLVPSGVDEGGLLGEEGIAASPDGGTVYFTVYNSADCTNEIESVPVSGGTPADVVTGELPAVSPDGSQLAFTRQNENDCGEAGDAQNFSMAIRTLSTGSQVTYPMAPDDTGRLPYLIDGLSWAPGGKQLVVSMTMYQDSQGYQLVLLNPATAQFYETGPGTTTLPVTGSPAPSRSYYAEGAFLPDGNLFVNRDCCIGVDLADKPPANSNLMEEISTSGSLVRQVAIGVQDDYHFSLSVDPSGNLLYVASTGDVVALPSTAAGTLYVSQGGAKPVAIATGILAAAWL
jgi:hypothetical protein